MLEQVAAVLEEVARARETITYEGLLSRLADRDPALAAAAREDLAALLRRVSIAEDDAGRGLLTAVVVREGSGLPGGGWFRLAAARGRDGEPESVWRDELTRVWDAHSPRR